MAIPSIPYLSLKSELSFSLLCPTAYKVDFTWIYSRYSKLSIFHVDCFTSVPQTYSRSYIPNVDEYTNLLSHSSQKPGNSESSSSTPAPIQCITQSPSLQVTIIYLQIVTERAIFPLLLLYPLLSSSISFSTAWVSFLKCQSHCVSPMLKICLSLACYWLLKKVPNSWCSLRPPS